jgi:hypothetical protein
MGGGGGIRGSCDLRTEDVRRGAAEGDGMEERLGDAAGGVFGVERDSIVVQYGTQSVPTRFEKPVWR